MHGGKNPEIVNLFWNKKILKPQKHLISVRHWVFSMTLGFFSGGCFFQNNFDVHRSGYKQYKFSFVQSVF